MNVGMEEERQETLRALGLDKAPEPRLGGLEQQQPSGRKMITVKKALQLVDPLESVAFEKYIPSEIVIDQTVDTRAYSEANTQIMSIPTDVRIPSNRRVFASTGIGEEPNAHNHYLWLAQELGRILLEMGTNVSSPPLLFRTSGANGTRALLGVIVTLVDPKPEQGATWALLGPRAPEVRLEGEETVEDVK